MIRRVQEVNHNLFTESRGILGRSGDFILKSNDKKENIRSLSESNEDSGNDMNFTNKIKGEKAFSESRSSLNRKNFIWQQDFRSSSLPEGKLYKIEEEKEKNSGVADEISILQEELKRKDAEIMKYQEMLSSKNPSRGNSESEYVYERISKVREEKKRIENEKKMNSMGLELQISQKDEKKKLELEKKQKEQMFRLEMLKIMRENEFAERKEKSIRAQAYKEQLDVQASVKSLISQKNFQPKSIFSQGGQSENKLFAYNKPNPFAKQPTEPSFLPSPSPFTKKSPKTLCFNPITGALKDTSAYIKGPHPDLLVNSQKIQEKPLEPLEPPQESNGISRKNNIFAKKTLANGNHE